MRRTLEILGTGLKMALGEFRSNKLRTFLSLFGITIGIFCIIGVLATVNSLEENVQKDIKALGSNTIFIDKWDYSGQIPYWKLLNRPVPKIEELPLLRKTVPEAANIAFALQRQDPVEMEDQKLDNVRVYGITEDFSNIQNIEVIDGRYFQQTDFDYAANSVVMGYKVAEELFGKPEKAVGRKIVIYKKIANVVGLVKKQGSSIIGGWEFDNCILLPYGFMKGLVKEEWSQPVLMLQGREHIPMAALRDETAGAMRSIRKLKPRQADNFSLNDIDAFGEFAAGIFSGINMGGFFIAVLSLLVGMFGVANIMFVTVRERTSQIGLKKAIGAKRMTILMEFLMESAFLCIMGGLMGLLLVFLLTLAISSQMGFPITISFGIMAKAIGICIFVGILAGIIPASIAAKMDPVVAIRSN
ncbi:ABC transporter permease [Flavihumibacter petaseus]|uniref:Putative ABC transporter permease protein n=1 Tax=Flavihumibacter petaseus NBRC 106054 TaxID=1220578 RepID=A0A0E9N2R0_9BACT|nr:ABC transporter permease [Flavihumibacter petaseus]GAO43921.1 putative ABC transporter permease protein [Flavihumibacter petaseus NBRC 106054]